MYATSVTYSRKYPSIADISSRQGGLPAPDWMFYLINQTAIKYPSCLPWACRRYMKRAILIAHIFTRSNPPTSLRRWSAWGELWISQHARWTRKLRCYVFSYCVLCSGIFVQRTKSWPAGSRVQILSSYLGLNPCNIRPELLHALAM